MIMVSYLEVKSSDNFSDFKYWKRDINANIFGNIIPYMYRDKSKVFISVYMFCYGRTKFISISSVILLYRTVFFVNKYCNATEIMQYSYLYI